MDAFGIIGWSGSGKTTLIEGLLPVLGSEGLAVGVLKHTHHGPAVDDIGKDSERFRRAGALEVLLTASDDMANSLAWFATSDLVLIEGFKVARIPKIEVYRKGTGPTLHPGDPWILVVVTGDTVATSLPVLRPDDHAGIAEFVLARRTGPGCNDRANRG